MMTIKESVGFTKELIKLLGLEGKGVQSIDMTCRVGQVVEFNVGLRMFLEKSQQEPLLQLMREHDIKP